MFEGLVVDPSTLSVTEKYQVSVVSGAVASDTVTMYLSAGELLGANIPMTMQVDVTTLPPVAEAVSANVKYDSSNDNIGLNLSGGIATSVAVATAPAHGAAVVAGTSILYTPNTGFYGTDSFTYTAGNIAGASNSAVASITVSAPDIAVTPGALTEGTIGVPYKQTLIASGGEAPYSFATTVASGALPAGLSLSASGVISGTPTASGVFIFTVAGTDSSTPVVAQFTSNPITLTVPALPVLTSISPAVGSTAGGTVVTIHGQNLGGVTKVTFAGVDATNVSVTGTTEITATSPAHVSGLYAVRLVGSNGTSAVTAAGEFRYGAAPDAEAVTADVKYDSANDPIALELRGGAATSVAIAKAAVHGTATAAGTTIIYTPHAGYFGSDHFTYTATNAIGTSKPALASITILPPDIVVAPTTLVEAKIGIQYKEDLVASGGKGPYHFDTTVASGALPAGLSLSASGAISGKPTTAGTYAFTVAGTDSSLPTAAKFTSKTITLIVPALPVLTSISPATGSTAGGTVVKILGQNLGGVTKVTFAGDLATNVTVTGTTEITATSPPHVSGLYDVRLIAPGGTSAVVVADEFRYEAPVATVLYRFTGHSDGENPQGTLALDSAGNLYGATADLEGNSNVFRLAPADADKLTWKLGVLRSFAPARAGDGANPAGVLLDETRATLYGTIGSRGFCTVSHAQACGTAFALASPLPGHAAWEYGVVHDFGKAGQSADAPLSPLVADADGSLFGMSAVGETAKAHYGTVFKLTPPAAPGRAWTKTVLYTFKGGIDGEASSQRLMIGEGGSIFGVAAASAKAGEVSFGSIFGLTPSTGTATPWTKTTLHNFTGGRTDGANPSSPLLWDGNGAFYGATAEGGLGSCGSVETGCGTIYKLVPSSGTQAGWTETVIYRFRGGSDGALASGQLAFDGERALYGTTRAGGSLTAGHGTVFKLTEAADGKQWTESILYRFHGSDGSEPVGGVLLGTDGEIYGATRLGGIATAESAAGGGVIYRLDR